MCRTNSCPSTAISWLSNITNDKLLFLARKQPYLPEIKECCFNTHGLGANQSLI